MLGKILLWLMTHFITVVTATVILIQKGGWLPILTALLLILFYFISGSLTMMAMAIYGSGKKEKEEIK